MIGNRKIFTRELSKEEIDKLANGGKIIIFLTRHKNISYELVGYFRKAK